MHLIWRRAPAYRRDKWHGKRSKPDALKFEAKVNCIVLGFLWGPEFHQSDFLLEFKFRVDDGPESQKKVVTFKPTDL